MIKLDKTQRKELAKPLYDIGKLVFAALVIGPFIAPAPFRFDVFIVGLILFIATFTIATMLNKED